MYAVLWKRVRGELMPALGSDGVVYFDGRWSIARRIAHARAVAIERKQAGFSIQSGPMNRQHDREVRPFEAVDKGGA